MVKIAKKRLKTLEMAEAKLNALEAGGVENWEFYGESLKEYYLANNLEEKRELLFNSLEIAFGECAYEPSERGSGIAFNDVHDDILEIFNSFGVIFKDEV